MINRKFDKFWAQEEAWIRKGVEARRTRNEGRVRRLEALLIVCDRDHGFVISAVCLPMPLTGAAITPSACATS